MADLETMLSHIVASLERLEEKLDEFIADMTEEPDEGDEEDNGNVWGWDG